jgi:PBSX family phage portal protein
MARRFVKEGADKGVAISGDEMIVPIEERLDRRTVLKAMVIGPDDSTVPYSKKSPWDNASFPYIEPPFDLFQLSLLPENNSELSGCVDAMKINIDSFGHRFVSRPWVKDSEEEAVQEEHLELINFFDNCNPTKTFTSLREDLRSDLEKTGIGFLEVIPNLMNESKIDAFEHLESYTMRLTGLDKKPIRVPFQKLIITKDGPTIKTVKAARRFRRYVQYKNGKYVWFKEWGDPRQISIEDGTVATKKLPYSKRANPAIYFKIYSPRSPYGLPRFMGALLTMYGMRSAENINYATLHNNNIPSVLMLVGGGALTPGSVDRIKEFVNASRTGMNFSRFLIVEAEPLEEGFDGSSSGKVQLKAQPMASQQKTDAMFVQYDEKGAAKLRTTFRIPGIVLGKGENYGRATALAGLRQADEQVFGPERSTFDSIVDKRILLTQGWKYHMYRSNGPSTTDNSELAAILTRAERTGGMNPRIARKIMNEIFGQDLGKVTKIDPDIPFTLQLAEAAKKLAPVNQGTVTGITGPSERSINAKKSAVEEVLEDLAVIKNTLSVDLQSTVDSVIDELIKHQLQIEDDELKLNNEE